MPRSISGVASARGGVGAHRLAHWNTDCGCRLWDYSTAAIAAQLTVIEAELFRQVRASEFVDMRWQKQKQLSPTLTALSERFNMVWLCECARRSGCAAGKQLPADKDDDSYPSCTLVFRPIASLFFCFSLRVQVANWTTTCIVLGETAGERTRMMKKFISIGMVRYRERACMTDRIVWPSSRPTDRLTD